MERQCADRSQVSNIIRSHVLWLQCLYEKVLVAGGGNKVANMIVYLQPHVCKTRQETTRLGKSRQDKIRE